jgi:hypothetical protein
MANVPKVILQETLKMYYICTKEAISHDQSK